MKLYFVNSKGVRRVIAEPATEEDVDREIDKFCEERNFEICYTRTWRDNDGLKWYDVGSWSEFFICDDRD